MFSGLNLKGKVGKHILFKIIHDSVHGKQICRLQYVIFSICPTRAVLGLVLYGPCGLSLLFTFRFRFMSRFHLVYKSFKPGLTIKIKLDQIVWSDHYFESDHTDQNVRIETH